MTRGAAVDDTGDPATMAHQLTMTSERLAKVLGRYDDEWGYSRRLVDLVGRPR